MFKSIKNLFNQKNSSIPPEKRPVLIADPVGLVPDHTPDYIDPCFCGSEKYFKDCCGSNNEKRLPPYGVFVFPSFIDKNKVKELRELADFHKGKPLMVVDEKKSTPDNLVEVVDERRVAEHVELGNDFNLINDLVRKAFTEIPPKYFNCEVEWYERPTLMRYHAGGYYYSHADSENMNLEQTYWKKIMDRDLSLLLYLNDDYEGGELFFRRFNYRIRPKAGMAIMFPSDNRYIHTAETVEEGVRYAIVSWASVKGIKKVLNQRPNNCFEIN